MPMSWVAERLGMGSLGYVAWLPQKHQRRGSLPRKDTNQTMLPI